MPRDETANQPPIDDDPSSGEHDSDRYGEQDPQPDKWSKKRTKTPKTRQRQLRRTGQAPWRAQQRTFQQQSSCPKDAGAPKELGLLYGREEQEATWEVPRGCLQQK